MADNPVTRKRDIVLRDDPWRGYYRGADGTYGWNNSGRYRVVGRQVTTSEGHPWKENSSFQGQDIGGAFRTEKKWVEENRTMSPNPLYTVQFVNRNNNTWFYTGPCYAVEPNDVAAFPFPASIESSDAELDAWGTKAIALCKPTNSIADLTTALAETAREGIPSMIGKDFWETRLRDIRATGSEYLNVTFGWLPLVSEIKNAAKAARESEKILAQYERDAGRVVRRKFEFPTIRTTGDVETITAWGRAPFIKEQHGLEQYSPFNPNPSSVNQFCKLTKVRSTETRRWFSGAFSYYLPTGYDSRSKIQRAALLADKLYGISLTPETLWNLTPWSWATDYVFNMGDVLSNVSDYMVNGLVLRYGYMMETTIVKDTYTLHNVPFARYGMKTLSLDKITQVKKRRPATPFGFGLTYDGLSVQQKAILAAIGLTRF